MKRTVKTPKGNNSKSLYEELKPTFLCMRILGLAPFSITDGGELTPSRKFGVLSYVLMAATIYCAYCVALRREYEISKSALSVLMFKVIGSSKSLHVALCLLNFTCRTGTFSKAWTLVQDINANLEALGITIDVAKCKKANLRTTAGFCASTVIYFVLYCAIMEEHLSQCFWIIAIVPPFYTTLLIFLFCTFTTKIRHRVSLVNSFLRRELRGYRIKVGSVVKLSWRSEWEREESGRAAKKFRNLKIIHLKVYKAVKYLNKLFGAHFFIIFVLYFCTGTLYSFTIIRYFTGQIPRGIFLVTVYAIAGDTIQIAFVVYGAIILEKEVHYTVMLVHKFLTLLSENDINIDNELQSFAMQLKQCRVGFSAAGFFSMDYTKLLQFGVAFFSNAVFFLQIDEIQKVRSGRNTTSN